VTLSVVVPTWNEELWLPRLLHALAGHPEVAEIVVADNASTDRTREVAARFGCRIVTGGRPAEGRNRGAAAARGDRLLFVDADVLPTKAALRKLAAPATADAVHFRLLPIADDLCVRTSYAVADWWFVTLEMLGIRHGLTNFLLVTRASFEDVGGFDERLDPGEDVDFVRRLSRVANIEYERRAPVLISARRFSAESAPLFAAKTVFWEGLRLVGVRANPLRYRWLEHDPRVGAREDAWLARRRAISGD
jgi:glycosyltransferase involved in cell wall biosynthesis